MVTDLLYNPRGVQPIAQRFCLEPMTVYKIGGSLFDLPGLTDVLRSLLDRNPHSPVLFMAGGGAAADAVRAWDRAHQLGDETAHDLALASMDLTSLLLARLVPAFRPVRSVQQVRMAAADGVPGLLCADCFIKSAEAQGHPRLERSWRITSDSIAAWAARVAGAAEFVLVKSVPCPTGSTLAEAAQAGLVDEAFPAVAAKLPAIGWVNARAQPVVVETWSASMPIPATALPELRYGL
jgi:5-(aminomethyl)-3-furanmethanol phosphate kinase